MILYTIPEAEAIKFGLVLVRVSGIMTFAPFWGSSTVPMALKATLSLVISFLLYPAIGGQISPPEFGLLALTLRIFGELAVGMLIGLLARLLFAGFELAGQLIGFQIGFSLVNIIDPQSSVESATVPVIESLVGLILFLGLDGHHLLLRAMADSFSAIDAFMLSPSEQTINLLLGLSAQIFVIGLQVAAPVLAMLVLTDIVLGIVGRAAFQIQILLIGMPVKSLIGFFALSVSLYFLPRFVESHLIEYYRQAVRMVRLLAG